MINACVRRASEAAGTGKRPGGLGGETPSPDGVESIQRRTQTPYLLDEARVREDHRHIRRLYLQAMHRNSYRHMCQHSGPYTHTTPAAPARECAVCPAGRGAHAMSAWRGCAAPAQTCRRSPKHVGGRPPPLKTTAPLDTHSTHARTHACTDGRMDACTDGRTGGRADAACMYTSHRRRPAERSEGTSPAHVARMGPAGWRQPPTAGTPRRAQCHSPPCVQRSVRTEALGCRRPQRKSRGGVGVGCGRNSA